MVWSAGQNKPKVGTQNPIAIVCMYNWLHQNEQVTVSPPIPLILKVEYKRASFITFSTLYPRHACDTAHKCKSIEHTKLNQQKFYCRLGLTSGQ